VPHVRDEERLFRERAVACLDGLYAFALSLGNDRAQAEDLVQECYLRAFRAARRPGSEDELRPWLFTILHNVFRNERRSRVHEPLDELVESGEPALSQVPELERDLDRAAASDGIARAIRELPHAYREVVALRFGEGLSYREIAGVLACPAGTVMSRLARARALIRRAVAGSGLKAVAGGRQ
jgi:RNA polymerase sigma-70 factor (ECF subfamily)